MKIGDEVYIHGYVDEIRQNVVIIRNDGGYFGTVAEEITSRSEIPNTCGDAISRKAVLDLMRCLTRWCVRSEDGKFNNVGLLYDDVMFGIDRLPSVSPQQRIGRWSRKTKVEDVYDIAGVKTWGIKCQCDRCDFSTTVIEDFGYYKWCPNCGAKMEVEE